MPIYRDIYDGPPRWYTDRRTRKKYIMIHATANTASAEAEADYAKRRPDRTSSHYYVDDDSIVQSLNTDLRAWHAGNVEGNDHAISYELTARNMNVGRAWWLDLDNIEWPLMTAAIARDCREHGITPRELSDSQLRGGAVTGFTTHVQGNRVWGGSSHTDPGPNFPMDHLVRQVRAALEDDMPSANEIARAVWGYRWDKLHLPDQEVSARYAVAFVHKYAVQLLDEVAELRAMVAAGAGEDIAGAVRAELDRHRPLLLAAVAEQLDGLGDRLAEALPDVPPEQVRAAVAAELAELRLVAEPAGQESA